MKIIENVFLFKNLSDADKKQIIKSLPEPQNFKKGEKIYSPDSFSHCLCVITKGKAAAKSSNVICRSFGAGDTFGAAALFGAEDTYSTVVYAVTDCSVVFISEILLDELFAKYPACAKSYILFLSEKIRFLNKKIELLAANTSLQKLYLYLCENSGKKLNFTAVSKATGIGRTSLYRSLAQLQENGMIIKNKNTVEVVSK